MDQVHHPNAAHQSVFCSAILEPDELHEAGIPFVLHTVVGNQERIGAVLDQPAHQFPQMARREMVVLKEIGDGIMADSTEVIC
jgi:hypothetical protein